jgi:hypothetical protein
LASVVFAKGVPEFKLSQQDGLPCPFCGGVGAAAAKFWDNYFPEKPKRLASDRLDGVPYFFVQE